MKAFISLGKYGDIITSLPIIYEGFKKTGEVQTVITSEKYSDVFFGCSYILPIGFGKSWGDLHSAIRFAKQNYEEIQILQSHGDRFPFQQTQPSFQQEVYLRAGVFDKWDKLDLVFDNRDAKREKALVKKFGSKEPFILIGDHSESSAFEHIEELIKMVLSEFGTAHKIIRLSAVKAEKIYDLIGLYDKAAALITIDTVHAHLCQASKVPKLILSADSWRGSAFRKNLTFYAKYAEWETRKNELISALKSCLGKNQPMKVTPFKTDKANGYNLSMVEFEGRKIYSYRYHPENNWKTKLMICNGEIQFELVPENDQSHSYEDLRLFVLNGLLHGIYTVSAIVNGQFRCYVAFGEIKRNGDAWTIGHVQIKYPRNDFTSLNKNFTPFIYQGKLALIYGIREKTQVVLCVDNDGKVLSSHISEAPTWPHGEIRGDAIIERGDTLLRFFHSRTSGKNQSFRYHVGASIMENKTPFKTLKVCSSPVISGDEELFTGCGHFKACVSICYGAIQEGDKTLLSIGKNDSRCLVYELQEKDLNL